MHGKQFLLDAIHAGINEHSLYGRLDFSELPSDAVQLIVDLEVSGADVSSGGESSRLRWRITADIDYGLRRWELRNREVLATSEKPGDGVIVAMTRRFEFQLPLKLLRAGQGTTINLHYSLWREGLPIDALPVEGALPLHVVSEEQMQSELYNYSISS
jgi:hypothetical protein